MSHQEAEGRRQEAEGSPSPPPPLPHSPTPESPASDRYARQTIFYGIGPEGQARLARARVAVIGCGALGTVIADHLARAGVGYLRIVDRDFVELTNLQRQVLYDERDVERGAPKAVAAVEHLRRVNSDIQLEAAVEDVNADSVLRLVEGVDLVMDGTDNFETRYLLNEACVKLGLPWIYSAAVASYGVTMTVLPGESSCLRCVFPHSPPPGTEPTCDTAGVLNPIPGIISALACAEALKLLVGAREQLSRAMVWMDVWHNVTQHVPLAAPKEDCPVCRQGRYEHLEAQQGSAATALCGRNAVQVRPRGVESIDLAALEERLSAVGSVTRTPYLLRFASGDHEVTLFPDARAIIKGTDDPAIARGIYARYIGL